MVLRLAFHHCILLALTHCPDWDQFNLGWSSPRTTRHTHLSPRKTQIPPLSPSSPVLRGKSAHHRACGTLGIQGLYQSSLRLNESLLMIHLLWMIGDENALECSLSFLLRAKLAVWDPTGSGKDEHLDREMPFRRRLELGWKTQWGRWTHVPTHWFGERVIDTICFSLSRLVALPSATHRFCLCGKLERHWLVFRPCFQTDYGAMMGRLFPISGPQ